MTIRTSRVFFWLVVSCCLFSASIVWGEEPQAKDSGRIPTAMGDIVVYPVQHASFIMTAGNHTVYVDPVGKKALYDRYPNPTLILLTDIHGDHLDKELLAAFKTSGLVMIGPQAVAEKVPGIYVMNNGDMTAKAGIDVEAVPMYNMTEDRLAFHPRGRGNGYIIRLHGKRIYISGDTENIPEMLALKGIDIAFVCMNLPYTMDEKTAAEAVLAFAPDIVYPYHYRGKKNGQTVFHDIEAFKKSVGKNQDISVRFLKWY